MTPAQRVLVTGAAGFIGSTLVDHLLAEGREVVGLDSFDPFYPAEQKRRNLEAALGNSAFRLEHGDIRDPRAVERAIDGREFDAMVHLAALAGVRPSLERPAEYSDVNVRGTAIMLDAAVRCGGPRFLLASSSSVYGERSDGPFRETDRADRPVSPYAATKRSAELTAHAFHHAHGLPVTCVRIFTAYGPRQRPDLAIRRFAERMLGGREVPIYGDGTSVRDFTFVDDLVDGLVRAMDGDQGFAVLNFGAGRTTSVREVVELLERELGVSARIDWLPPQSGDVSRTWADISAARDAVGYAPRIELEEGIGRFIKWLRRVHERS